MPDGVNIPGGPAFIGLPQPPDVPCDPTGDGWRGPPGPPGPPMGSFVSDTAPLSPVSGQLWFDSSNPQLYVWFVDPTSAQWVIATAYAGGLTSDAPSDGQTYGRQNGAWTNVTAGGPYLPLTGGTLTGPLNYTATGGTTSRSAQDRAAETIYAEDYGVVPNAPDNTVALQSFFAALQAKGGICKGRLPAGWINFTAPMTIATGVQHWTLEGAGISTTWLNYTGAGTTANILTITGCNYFTLRDFTIDSATAMTAGTGLHIYQSGHGFLSNIKIAGQTGTTHTGGDGNKHYNLWNGLWFDQTDMMSLHGFEMTAQNDAMRVNGSVGAGAKAGLFMQMGKILGAAVGVHVGGAFGGLWVDNCDIIANWHNCVIDQTLAAEANREIFFGPHVAFDSSGVVGTPTAPGSVNPGGTADNVVVSDIGGGFLTIRSWIASATRGGNNVRIINWAGTINLDGCIIYQAGIAPGAAGDGVRIETSTPVVLVSPTTNISGSSGYGINQTIAMNPVIGIPWFAANVAGNTSPTTKLQIAGGSAMTTSYANDAAAATGGVAVGQLYRNGSAVMVRVA